MPDFPQIDKAGKWDVFIQQGSTFLRTLSFVDFDISEFSFRGQIKKQYSDRKPLATYTVTVTSNSEIDVYLSSQASANLVPGTLFHDIEMYYQESGVDVFVARIAEGKVKVTPEITR